MTTANRALRLLGAAIVATASLTLSGCMTIGGGATTTGPSGAAGGSTVPVATPEGPDLSAPTTETVQIMDPVEEAFWVDVPQGWSSAAYLSSEGDVQHFVVTSVSPDGRTVLFLGDPRMPQYWDPDQAHEVTRNFAQWLDLMELARYIPAEQYLPDYTQRKFGELPGFAVTGMQSEPETVASLQTAFEAAGMGRPEAHAATVYFTYLMDDGTPMEGIVQGYTIHGGPFWQVQVQGLATDRSAAEYLPMLTAMNASVTTNPDYTARRNAAHQQAMADIQAEIEAMTARHQANMAWIQRSAQAHQQRMQAIWAANDASMASFYDRMDSMDRVQQSFLNYINEENTVAPMGSTGGQTWQVQTGYDRYWVNPSTGEYLGGDINFDDRKIREMGLDPNDYQEVTILR